MSDQPYDENSTSPHKHSQQTDIHALGGIRNLKRSKRTNVDPRLRLPGQRDRLISLYSFHPAIRSI